MAEVMRTYTIQELGWSSVIAIALTLVVTYTAQSMAPRPDELKCIATVEPRPIASNFELIRVVDGDTQVVMVELGLDTYRKVFIRLLDVDTPEPRGETKASGKRATRFAVDWYEKHKGALFLHSDGKTGKFGRLLARVCPLDGDGVCLGKELIRAGHVAK